MMVAMSSRRRPFGRILAVVALVLLALLLLELERFLPGSWPGGGGDSGSRSFPTGAKTDPERLVPSTTPPPPAKRPADGPTIRVVLRRAAGTPVDRAQLEAGDPLRSVVRETTEDGEFELPIATATSGDLVVTTPEGGTVTHGRPPPGADGAWILVLPRNAPPARRDGAKIGLTRRSVRVVDAEGRPVANATVTSSGAGGERRDQSAADGTVSVDRSDAGLRRVCVTAPGFGETCVYARFAPGEPVVVRLSPARPRRTTFVDAVTGEALAARSLRLVDRQGRARRLEHDGGTFERFEATMPDDVAAETTLEIDVDGRPPVRVPVASLAEKTPVPSGVSRTVRVTDESGAPVEGAVVTARFAAGPSPESGAGAPLETGATTDAAGRAVLALPADRDADVVVEAKDLVVAGLRLSPKPADAAAAVEVRTPRGADVRVEVRDAKGLPVAGADVLALFAADRSTARRRATTDASGAATVVGVREGRVEILVHRAGFAWASASTTAAPGAAAVAVELKAGKRLMLVVEDPSGLPLAGVSVRSVPRADAAAGVPDPSDPDAPPWETDAHGVLVVDDLPDREVDLYLTKAAHGEEILARVRPGGATWFATMVPTPR